jgi:hypothetical protein
MLRACPSVPCAFLASLLAVIHALPAVAEHHDFCVLSFRVGPWQCREIAGLIR